jgi:hypothetical protein
MFLMVAHLIIPKMADASGTYSVSIADSMIPINVSNRFTANKDNTQEIQHSIEKTQENRDYEPPNYGGPESQYGSGTR